jgi:hypothetical protein
MEYTQLDKSTRLNLIRARIRDIEQQYLTLSLKVQAPDLNQPIGAMDQANLSKLETSLDALHQMEAQLSQS